MSIENHWLARVQEFVDFFRRLPESDLQKLRALSGELTERKRALQALAARADCAARCAGCGGACCVTGKYHFTPVDLLVHLATAQPLFAPHFGNGLCPYLGESGCQMAPAYRPFNCITFNCELIEDCLSAQEVSSFYQLERELRRNYLEIRALFPGSSLDRALLD